MVDARDVKLWQRNLGARLGSEIAVLLDRVEDDGIDGWNWNGLKQLSGRLFFILFAILNIVPEHSS